MMSDIATVLPEPEPRRLDERQRGGVGALHQVQLLDALRSDGL